MEPTQALCHDHQRRAGAAAGLIKSLIETDFAHYDEAAMAHARAALADILGAYQRVKHEGIFDPAIRSGDERRAQTARRMKIACIAAGEDVRSYVRRWQAVHGHEHWSEYRLSTLTMLTRLRDHLDTERQALDALMAG